jgi:hypothetical protein
MLKVLIAVALTALAPPALACDASGQMSPVARAQAFRLAPEAFVGIVVGARDDHNTLYINPSVLPEGTRSVIFRVEHPIRGVHGRHFEVAQGVEDVCVFELGKRYLYAGPATVLLSPETSAEDAIRALR